MAYNQRMPIAHPKGYTNRNTIICVSKTTVDLTMAQRVPEGVSHFIGTDFYPLTLRLRFKDQGLVEGAGVTVRNTSGPITWNEK